MGGPHIRQRIIEVARGITERNPIGQDITSRTAANKIVKNQLLNDFY
jgi:hypothetical protein